MGGQDEEKNRNIKDKREENDRIRLKMGGQDEEKNRNIKDKREEKKMKSKKIAF